MSRVTPLLLSRMRVGQGAHADAPAGRPGDGEQGVVLGEGQVVLGAQLLVEATRHPGVGLQEGAPRLESRVAGGERRGRPASVTVMVGCYTSVRGSACS